MGILAFGHFVLIRLLFAFWNFVQHSVLISYLSRTYLVLIITFISCFLVSLLDSLRLMAMPAERVDPDFAATWPHLGPGGVFSELKGFAILSSARIFNSNSNLFILSDIF